MRSVENQAPFVRVFLGYIWPQGCLCGHIRIVFGVKQADKALCAAFCEEGLCDNLWVFIGRWVVSGCRAAGGVGVVKAYSEAVSDAV